MRIRFITSTPLNVFHGSGTYVGISTLATWLRRLGAEVEIVAPSLRTPIYTLDRLLFNESLGFRKLAPVDITVGFDMDGYTLSRRHSGFHVASLKGVIADELRFESGVTRATMRIQAACERAHVRTAHAVIATSRYSAEHILNFYQPSKSPSVVPELIDLADWKARLQPIPEAEKNGKFIVLCICRFYPRKRVNVLLRAAARLRLSLPALEVRIVGGGPEHSKLKKIWEAEKLQDTVVWMGNLSQEELLREYKRCHVFCLPSVQEGFGIVFLEAMASGKPIIAARAAAVPEVVTHGLLVDPENDEALAAAMQRLYQEPALRQSLGQMGSESVKQFDAPKVARMFLSIIEDSMQARKEQSKIQ